MRQALRILLVGYAGDQFRQMESLLTQHAHILVTPMPLIKGEECPIASALDSCDVIILLVDENWRVTMQDCFGSDTQARKPLLIVGPAAEPELMRMAMHIGARDFYTIPLRSTDLLPELDRLAKEEYARHGALMARVVTFMNAKGGSGASICAANYAHILAKLYSRRTVLLDFELQFGSLPTYFNLQSRNGLIRALELVDQLDTMALQGFTQQHSNNLYLLAAATESLVLPEEIHEDRIAKLFAVLDDAFQDIVIDLPRRIDRATVAVLDRSDLVILLVQQTVAHLQSLKRLANMLRADLGLPTHRQMVIVNRFDKRGEVTLKDFANAVPGIRIETLPNDYQDVSESINLGVPLLDQSPGSALSKALKDLVVIGSASTGEPAPQKRPRGFWSWLGGKAT